MRSLANCGWEKGEIEVVDDRPSTMRDHFDFASMLDDSNRMPCASPASIVGLVITGSEAETGNGYFSYPRNWCRAAF